MTLDDILGPVVDVFTEDQPVVLIDSDTITFRAAAATDGRMYTINGRPFKYKEDIVKYCKKNDLNVDDIEIDYYPEPLSHALKVVKVKIEEIKRYARDRFPKGFNLEFYHTGKGNFRKEVITTYKDSRADTRKPEHLQACKNYVNSRFPTFLEEGLEADDLIGIRAYQLRGLDIPYLIVSNDKDLDTIPGEHFNWVKSEEYDVTPLEAMCFFYAQCIAGDGTDDIPGIKGMGINKKGTGKAQKAILKATEEKGFEQLTMSQAERVLYEVALDVWLSGGPGKNGSYGCESLEDITKKFKASAQCLLILHERDRLWEVPNDMEGNYE